MVSGQWTEPLHDDVPRTASSRRRNKPSTPTRIRFMPCPRTHQPRSAESRTMCRWQSHPRQTGMQARELGRCLGRYHDWHPMARGVDSTGVSGCCVPRRFRRCGLRRRLSLRRADSGMFSACRSGGLCEPTPLESIPLCATPFATATTGTRQPLALS